MKSRTSHRISTAIVNYSDISPMENGRTDLSSFNNDWYQPGSAFLRLCWMLVSALFFQHSLAVGSSWKCALLRLFGAKIGKSVVIKPRVIIKYPWNLTVGDYSWIGEGCWIDNLAEVTIAAHCCLSQGSMLLCGNHDYSKASFDLRVGKIELEDGVWIGAGSLVGPGVKCGSHSVLVVHSVASNDLEAYGIYRGNPAVKIKERKIAR